VLICFGNQGKGKGNKRVLRGEDTSEESLQNQEQEQEQEE
jgi:hypothetical protein